MDGLVSVNAMSDLPTLLDTYRELKAQSDTLAAQMKSIKSQLLPIIEASGPYKDDAGYVRITTRGSSIQYPGKEIDRIAKEWAASEDANMATWGRTLLGMRKVSVGTSYMSIK